MDHSEITRLKTELAEAVGLLESILVFCPNVEWENIQVFLACHAQCEQQEAQGAQAGDDLDQVHQLAFEIGEPDEDGDGYHFSADQLDEFVAKLNRAALATQPAAAEVVAIQARMPGGEWQTYPKGDAADLTSAGMELRNLSAVRGAEHGQ